MFEKILVGYAGDRAGHDAIALAAQLSRAASASLTVLFPYHPVLARETAEQAGARVHSEVRSQLAALQAAAGIEHERPAESKPAVEGGPGSDLDTSQAVECLWSSSSWPIRALHELAGYRGSDLIVLGTARETLGERLQPSVMARFVHGAPCAMAVAPAGYAESVLASGASTPSEPRPRTPPADGGYTELKRIGVGFASTPEGLAALRLARELAQRVGGRVQVIAGAGLEPALASYAFSSPALAEVEAEIYAETELALTRAVEEETVDVSIPIETETIRGEPARVLVERSSRLDLLVLGSRAYGPVRHVFLGSVSSPAMREARCPVLVVPRGVGGEDEHLRAHTPGVARPA